MDLFPIYLISFVMSLFIYTINFLNFTIMVTLLLQITGGLLIFVYLAYKLRLESLYYIRDLIKKKVFNGI